MKSLLTVMLVLSLGAVAAAAQSPKELKTKKGTPVALVNLLSTKPGCASNPGPVAVPLVREKPMNGAVQMMIVAVDVPASASCPARKVPAVTLFYTPKEGFAGIDAVGIEIETGIEQPCSVIVFPFRRPARRFERVRSRIRQRRQIMATYSLQPPVGQFSAPAGTEPVTSSGIDAPVGFGFGKRPRLTIAARRLRPAVLAIGKTLIDPVSKRWIGDDRHPVSAPAPDAVKISKPTAKAKRNCITHRKFSAYPAFIVKKG